MKKGLRPTRSQKMAMKAVGLNSDNWLVFKRYTANYTWYIGKQAQLELFQVIKGGEHVDKKAKLDALIKKLQGQGVKIDWCSNFPKRILHKKRPTAATVGLRKCIT